MGRCYSLYPRRSVTEACPCVTLGCILRSLGNGEQSFWLTTNQWYGMSSESMSESPARDARGRVLPGAVLNPQGKPRGVRGVARMIMNATDDGADFVNWALLLWKDQDAPIEWRWRAFEWLTRNVGLNGSITLNQLNVNVTSGRDLRALSPEHLERIDAVFQEAHGRKMIEASSVEGEP